MPSRPAFGDAFRVLLVNAPFGLIEYPHLGTSLIKATTEAAGYPCDILYASIEFAKIISFGFYRTLEASANPLLLPERVFARALSPNVPSVDAYLDANIAQLGNATSQFVGDPGIRRMNRDNLLRMEEHALRYVDTLAARDELGAYRVIGFSSSYGQHTASLAIAKRLKEQFPETIICFGGANSEGIMGQQLVRSFPFVDFAFSGDGDIAFPRFLDCLRDGRPVDVPGVYAADDGISLDVDTKPLTRDDLDALPYPDYSDYFAAYERAPEGKCCIQAVPIEGTRGCWWGEKHHCPFCGLNGLTMKYRSKSPQRFVDELEHLVTRYGQTRVMAADNILDMKYLRTVMPLLKERRLHEVLFFEVKSNLKREDLQALADAGVTEVQAGVESLSTHVLQLVDKGVTALQNVQFLKWAEEVGITVIWMILCGAPGETAADYTAMAELMRKIPHIQPPRGINRITVDRWAPYFKWPERYGLRIWPAPAYAYVYDLPPDELHNIAYWFAHAEDGGDGASCFTVPRHARRAFQVEAIWESQYGNVAFEYHVNADGFVELRDTRPTAVREQVTLDRLESAVFLLCDRVVTPLFVARQLGEAGWNVTVDEVTRVLGRFEADLVVHREGDHYLALAVHAAHKELRPFLAGGLKYCYLWRQVDKNIERRPAT